VVYADGLPVAQYLMEARLECPAIMDLHDCFTLLYSRTMQAEPRWLRKMALYAATRSIARLERSLSQVFSRIITNSNVDEAYLKMLDPAAKTLTIANGVDSGFFGPSSAESDMVKLVFTGVMDYLPNEDAAVYFGEAILPLIQENHPDVQFWVVGKDPTERVRVLAARPGVQVTGGVPDVRPYLQSAGIFVCPLRFGAGVKNKLLAALAMNKAVVATRLSVEGLDLREGEDLLLADDPAEFAAKVVHLIENPDYARQLGKTGQAAVKGRYSWERSAKLLEDTLRSVALP
jgi:glycosyltransferase involved in cell wall biosynthesis